MVEHNSSTNRLDFGGNLYPDPGIFSIAILAIIKTPHRGFGNGPKIRRLADLKLDKLKAALAKVCALRVLVCR